MPQVLQNTGWNRLADWVLGEVQKRLDTPQARKDGLGGFKRTTYKLNDTGSLSNSLEMEALQQDDGSVQLILTYPNNGENAIKGKIYLETGRRPGVGVRVDKNQLQTSPLYDWATRKLPGFQGLTENEQYFRLIRISMKIKQRGIGTFPVFDSSFVNQLGAEYIQWFASLTDEQIEQLPAIEEVFNVFNNIPIIDDETLDIFR